VTCWARCVTFGKLEPGRNRIFPPEIRPASHSPIAFAWGAVMEEDAGGRDSLSTVKLFTWWMRPRYAAGNRRLESPDSKPLVRLAFNRDGSRLAAATTDKCQVWDLQAPGKDCSRWDWRGTFHLSEPVSRTTHSRIRGRRPPDTETPRKWQEVERLTAVLSQPPNQNRRLFQDTFQRGKLFVVLAGRNCQADFERRCDWLKRCRYSRWRAIRRHETLRKTGAALDKFFRPVPRKACG